MEDSFGAVLITAPQITMVTSNFLFLEETHIKIGRVLSIPTIGALILIVVRSGILTICNTCKKNYCRAN